MKKALLFVSMLMVARLAQAQTSYTWNGSASSSWNTASNWTPNGVPGALDNVTIVSSGNTCTLSANQAITNFTLTSGAINLGSNTLTINGTAATFTSGTVQNGTINITGAATTVFGNSAVTMNCAANISAATITLRGATFQGTLNITKTGASNDASYGGNTFNGTTTITNAGSGYLVLANNSGDQFNAAVTFNNTGSNNIYVAHNSIGNVFNGVATFNNSPSTNNLIYVSWYSIGTTFNNNIVVSSASGQGVQFCGGNATSSATISSGYSISVGGGGFSSGTLSLRQFTQNGSAPVNISATGTAQVNLGPSSNFGGQLTVSAPNIYPWNSIFNGAVSLTKTDGTNSNYTSGGNTYNSTFTANYISSSGTGYWSFGYGAPDVYNGDVYSNNNSLDRIIFGHNSANNQFNGNLYVTQTGSSTGTTLTWNTGSSCVMAAGKTIFIGGAGFNTGYFYIQGLTQNGTAAMNLSTTGTSSIFIGAGSANNPSVIGGDLSITAPNVYLRGGTFNKTVTVTKTGGNNNDNNSYQNIFNSTLTINQQSNTGYFMLGNSSNDLFNDDITVSSTGSGGVYFGSGTGTPTLAAGKTILVGPGGFNVGFLTFGGFVQLGAAPISLTLTGSSYLLVNKTSGGPCSFGGAFTVSANDIYIRGGVFNSPATFTKTGGTNNNNSLIQNIFNSTLTINQQSNTGYFMLGYGSNDQYNDNITVTSTGTGGIYLGYGTGAPTLAAGKTILIGPAGFSAGFLALEGFTQLGSAPIVLNITGAAYLQLSKTSVPCNFGGAFTATGPDIYVQGATFNSPASFTKTGGTSNHNSSYQNIFNSTCTINQQSNTGYFMLGYNSNDLFNDNITITSTGSGGVYLGYTSGTGTPTLAAGKTILVGPAGFSNGFLSLNTFTQLGNAPISLNFTGPVTYLQVGNSSAIGGDFTVVSPRILLNGATYSGNVNLTKNGATGEWSSGGNIFNGTTTINQLGSGFFGFANGSPDVYNGDLYLNNNSTDRIILANTSINNQFNGNIIATQTGSSVGIALGWSAGATLIMAAGKTISIGAAGFNVGYFQIQRFTQLGNVPMNLLLTGTSSLTFGPSAAIGGNVTSTSASLYFNGCTFSGIVNSTKNGSTNDASNGNNIFNGNAVMTNAGAGYLMFGNGNADQFNAASIFNNTGSSNIYIAYNSSNNIFGGPATFNNAPTANTGIYVSAYSAGTVFNDNIIATSTNGQGVQFCSGNAAATATLAAGKTIAVGPSGFSAGMLLLRQFTQTGATPQSITLTGTGNLTFGPSSSFGGNVTTVSPTIYFNGCTFSGTVNSTKNGSTNDASSGNNTFNGPFTVTNTGSGYFVMGNTFPDTWQSTAIFNNYSTGQHMYVAHNSSGNIFNGDVTFNNQPGSTNLWIYSNYYGANTQFNGNVNVVNVNGAGVYFGAGPGSATLASGKVVSIGALGFNYGGLIFKSFIQNGSGTAQNITTTGSSYIQFSPGTIFNGALTSSSPGLFFNGATFNGSVNSTKTGSTNDQSTGGNTFNGSSTFTNTGTGYLMMTASGGDAYNNDVSFVKSNTGLIYPNYNNSSSYLGSLTVSSATAITFGANNGTAVLGGSATQNINAAPGTATPVFTRLIINNSAGGVTLNSTSINVSGTLTLTSGLLNTTTTNILTMLNGSAVAAGTALSTSYVNGPMRYQKSIAGSSTLNFPIGNGADCRPAVLTVNHSSGTLYTYQAQLFNASARALGYTMPPTVDHVSNVHYYTINRTDASGTSQPTAGLTGNQTIQLFFGSNDLVDNGLTLTIVKNTYTNLTKWIDIGGAGGPAPTGSHLTGSITSTSVPTAFNSFSTFAIADEIFGGNVLPTKLVYFNAELVNDDSVKLSWATATETSNGYFTIEKSSDGAHFSPLVKINSKALNGNSSSPLEYNAVDRNPLSGMNYYRLKQTDLDGNDTYYNIVSVQVDRMQTLTVYPNPTSSYVYVRGLSRNETNLRAEWYDLAGRLVKQETASVQNGLAQLTAPLINGTYILRFITFDGIAHEQKIIVKK